MKKFSVLVLLVAALVLLLTGISVPGRERPLHIILVTASIVIGFAFYLIVLVSVIRASDLKKGERVFWIAAIASLPMIGNLLFVLIHNLSGGKQTPKPEI